MKFGKVARLRTEVEGTYLENQFRCLGTLRVPVPVVDASCTNLARLIPVSSHRPPS